VGAGVAISVGDFALERRPLVGHLSLGYSLHGGRPFGSSERADKAAALADSDALQ
jgi:hypothetical protein